MTIKYNSNYDLTIPFSDSCAQVHLTTDTEQTYTVPGEPTDNYAVRFAYIHDTNVFIALNATPVVPAADTVGTQQYNELRPGGDGSQRYVKGEDVIHFITPDTLAYVSISLRKL